MNFFFFLMMLSEDSVAALPSHWDDMKGDIVKLVAVTSGSQEYKDVEKEFKRTGLNPNIISVCDNSNYILIILSYLLSQSHNIITVK